MSWDGRGRRIQDHPVYSSRKKDYEPYGRCMGSTGPLVCLLEHSHEGDCDLVDRHHRIRGPRITEVIELALWS